MDWLPMLLKHLSIARSAILALFIATAVMYFGPIFYPTYIAPLSPNWTNLLLGIVVLSGVLILVWCVEFLFSFLTKPLSKLRSFRLRKSLSNVEIHLMLSMSENPHSTLHLGDIKRLENCSRNDYLFGANNLVNKGFARLSLDRNSVWMTEKGIECAHALEKNETG